MHFLEHKDWRNTNKTVDSFWCRHENLSGVVSAVWTPIRYVTLKRSAQRSFAPLNNSRRNYRVWTEALAIRYGFRAGAKAIRYGVIIALIVASRIFVSILGSQTLDVKFAIIFLRYGYSVL